MKWYNYGKNFVMPELGAEVDVVRVYWEKPIGPTYFRVLQYNKSSVNVYVPVDQYLLQVIQGHYEAIYTAIHSVVADLNITKSDIFVDLMGGGSRCTPRTKLRKKTLDFTPYIHAVCDRYCNSEGISVVVNSDDTVNVYYKGVTIAVILKGPDRSIWWREGETLCSSTFRNFAKAILSARPASGEYNVNDLLVWAVANNSCECSLPQDRSHKWIIG